MAKKLHKRKFSFLDRSEKDNIYIYIYTHTHTHTYIYIYINIYMCVCVSVCSMFREYSIKYENLNYIQTLNIKFT